MSSDEEKKTLRELMEAKSLRGVAAMDTLHRFLKSVAAGAMDGHRHTAAAILGRADDLEEPERSILLEQMFPTLMRALEDYATLCLMWLDSERPPLEAYLRADKKEIRGFYTQVRKGLSDEAMFKIFGVSSPETMRKEGLVKEGDHYVVESVLGWAWDYYNRLLESFGRVYHSTVEDADEVIGPWQIAYAMSPLGTKMLLGEDGRPETLLLGVGEMEDPAEKGRRIPAVYSAPVSLDARFGEETLHHVDAVCQEIRELAARQLAMLKDPSAGLGRAREAFENNLKSMKKGHEMPLPGGSIAKKEEQGSSKTSEIKIKQDPARAGGLPEKDNQPQGTPGPAEDEDGEAKGITETIEIDGGLKIQHSKQLDD